MVLPEPHMPCIINVCLSLMKSRLFSFSIVMLDGSLISEVQ